MVGQRHDFPHGFAKLTLFVELGNPRCGFLHLANQQWVIQLGAQGAAKLFHKVTGTAGDVYQFTYQI